MTVAATFPAAVISMAIIRPLKGTILEENMARTTGAVGEALAAGAVFTIPAFLFTGVLTEFDVFKSSLLMLIGGVLGWLFLMPILLFISNDLKTIVNQDLSSWSEIAISAYNAQIKPIAVGAMLVGAFYTLFKMRKNLITGIGRSFSDVKKSQAEDKSDTLRTEKDLPFSSIIMAIAALIIPMVFVYNMFTHNISTSLISALVMIVMGLLFAAVAGYLVGIIGSSSNPISGLTLTTLLIAALMMLIMGQKGNEGPQ